MATEYLPDIKCVAEMLLEDSDGRKIILSSHSDGTYVIQREGVLLPETFKDLESDNEFYMFFSDLASLTRKRKQYLDDVLNDSRNYRGRFSANVKNDKIHVFYEEFNYSLPERNEYYLMEYVDGHYALSIAYKSMFMQEYLSDDEYYEHYHTHERIKRKTYSSLEEIDSAFNDIGRPRFRFYPDLYKRRKSAFKRMEKIVSEKLNEIKGKKLFIQNFDYIWDMPYDVLRYYDIEDAFNCKYDDEYGEIISANSSANFKDKNGDTVNITYEDIKLAFELGIESINEICRIKKEHGSIEYVLSE